MSRDGGRPGAPRRHITPDEAVLWSHTTLSVAKVRIKARVASRAAQDEPAAPRAAGPEAVRAKRWPSAAEKPAPAPPAAAPRRAPPVAGFDRRALRKVASGKVAIDATLDLHGLQRGDAHARLRAFLFDSQAQGHRMLLIVTGKGGQTADPSAGSLGRPERGVLRRNVPQWLEEPELQAIVLSHTPAGPRHGGSGALYVRLRKARETPG
jgi:DNA-nicking Smr family endonuclease